MGQLATNTRPVPHDLAMVSEVIARFPLSHLQPIKTPSELATSPERKKSTQSSISTKSPSLLPSPNATAAHAYYLDNAEPIESSSEASQRRRSLVETQSFPRRHSTFAPTKTLAKQFEGFEFPSANLDLSIVAERDEFYYEKLDKSLYKHPNDFNNIFDQRHSEIFCEPAPETLRQVPFDYTHNHLREWGHAYLGNSATADVFVTAVSLRRPSLALLQDGDLNLKTTTNHLVTIRARVLPGLKSRKPFLIQRELDIEQLRSSIPNTVQTKRELVNTTTAKLRRSTRLRRTSAQQISTKDSSRRGSLESQRGGHSSALGKGPIPVHIEYALHYLPVLAALMLSGHVRKGDTIDLPIPRPEAWRDVISYIYTGRGESTAAIRENMTFLAGRV